MKKRLVILALAVGLALSGGAIAVAQTATDSKPEVREPKPDGPRPPKRDERGERGGRGGKPHAPGQKGPDGRPHGPKFAQGFDHAIHGELLVPVRPAEGAAPEAKPVFETVTFDRGRVVSATDDQLTIERPDGMRVTVSLTDATRLRGVEKGSDLSEGAPVIVVAKDGVARHVGQPKARPEGSRPPEPKAA